MSAFEYLNNYNYNYNYGAQLCNVIPEVQQWH